jgi:hypothetical protein
MNTALMKEDGGVRHDYRHHLLSLGDQPLSKLRADGSTAQSDRVRRMDAAHKIYCHDVQYAMSVIRNQKLNNGFPSPTQSFGDDVPARE